MVLRAGRQADSPGLQQPNIASEESGGTDSMSENMEQAKFEGWAMVEMMGHQREIGYVTTEYFGGAALFRVDVPEIPEREIELDRPEYIGGRMVPEGSKVKRESAPGRTRFISPSALYAMNPCTEEVARKA